MDKRDLMKFLDIIENNAAERKAVIQFYYLLAPVGGFEKYAKLTQEIIDAKNDILDEFVRLQEVEAKYLELTEE